MDLPEIGDVLLEKYALTSVLGEGGFGVVFGGETRSTGRRVAVKVLRPHEEGYRTSDAARFLREMKTVAQLQSRCTVTLYDYGRTDDGLLCMVCEFVDGADLSDLLERRGRLTEDEAIHIASQVLESLAEAHGLGMLHRDIKPANIRIFEYGDDPLSAKVLDFGLARSFTGPSTKLTATGKVIGTPRYMAPEQMTAGDLSPATDLYGLGVVLLEMLLGRQVSERKPLWTSDFEVESGQMSEGLRLIANRLIARDVGDRYRTAHEASSELRALRAAAAPAVEDSPAVHIPAATTAERAPDRPRSLRIPLVVAAVVVGVVVASLLYRGADETADARRTVQTRREVVPVEPRRVTAPTVEDTAGPCAGYEALEPGIQQLAFMRGIDRETVWVRIPPGYDPQVEHRVIVLLHEGGNPPQLELKFVDGPHIRDTDVIVAPHEGRLSGSWTVNDAVPLIHAHLDTAARVACLDTTKLYVLGVGRGGFGAEWMRCLDDRVVAVANTAHREADVGLMCSPIRPVPTLEFHMTADPISRPDGTGCINSFAPMADHVATLESIHGCTGPARTVSSRAEGTCRTRTCAEPYVSCIVNGGRPWGAPGDVLGAVLEGCRSEPSGYPYGEAIWRFFDEYSAKTTADAEEQQEEDGGQ